MSRSRFESDESQPLLSGEAASSSELYVPAPDAGLVSYEFPPHDIESQTIAHPHAVPESDAANAFQFDPLTIAKYKTLRDCILQLERAGEAKKFKDTLKEKIIVLIKNTLILSYAGGFGYFTYDLITRNLLADSLLNDWEHQVFSHYDESNTCAELNKDMPHFGDLNFCSADFFPAACQDMANEYCAQATKDKLGWEEFGYAFAGFVFLFCLGCLVDIWRKYARQNFDLSTLRMDEVFNAGELTNIKHVIDQYKIPLPIHFLDGISIVHVLTKFKEVYHQDPAICELRNQLKIKNFANRLFFIASNTGPRNPKKTVLPALPPELYFQIFKQETHGKIQALMQSRQLEKQDEKAAESEKGKEIITEIETQKTAFNRYRSALFEQGFKKHEPDDYSKDVDTQSALILAMSGSGK